MSLSEFSEYDFFSFILLILISSSSSSSSVIAAARDVHGPEPSGQGAAVRDRRDSGGMLAFVCLLLLALACCYLLLHALHAVACCA